MVVFHTVFQLEWGFSLFTPAEEEFLTAAMVFMVLGLS
jgi:hypothetical protein